MSDDCLLVYHRFIRNGKIAAPNSGLCLDPSLRSEIREVATPVLENAVKANVTCQTPDNVSAIECGVPIIEKGKIIGAIGVSGGSAQQDGVIAGAGAAVIK